MESVNKAGEVAERTTSKRTRLRRLPSGRSVVLKMAGAQEEIEVRSPDGTVEVCITLTDCGAVVSLRGGRLELQSPDSVVVNSRRFEVNTTEGTQLNSTGDLQVTGRELRVQAESDIHMTGAVIHLN
jgi:hypothetical protein